MSARERLQVAYEAAYRKSEALPQPRITEIDMEIDLYPERRAFRSRGRYTLINRADVPIETVLVMVGMDRIGQVELEGADVAARQPRFNLVEFRARTPIAPGEARTLTFTTSDTRRGFEEGSDGSPVLYNGTFAHSPYLAPSIGVQRELYLQSDARRRAYGLEPLPGMAARDDKAQRRRNFINADADFIRFSATVSTSADQIALAPGNLEREWSEGGRKFFRYSTDRPILNFWSVVSGRYVVARDQWNGVELAVHHHPKHGRNVPRMLDAMKQALAYYTTQFGPYPHRQLRIAEFPRYAAPLVAAHEVGHQWWPHQVAGAAVEGAQFLSESLSEYSALMVAEHRYGAHRMRQYLKYELDTYLRQRGESRNERPLARVAMDQTYVHYQKGALALYALKDAIGETVVNRALARFLREYAYKTDPYPTSREFLQLLRAEAGPVHDQLITDLFEKITLWDLRVVGAEAAAAGDGKWRVRIEVRARKLDADGNGAETEIPGTGPFSRATRVFKWGHSEK